MSSATLSSSIFRGAYPERADGQTSKLDELGARLVRDGLGFVRARRKPWEGFAALASAHGDGFDKADDADLVRATHELRRDLALSGFTDPVVARSFALVRELASRTLGQRPFDVQLMGGWVLLHGMVAEMETGEGKTLTATLPASTAALAGVPVHVITVNDYLARRDSEWMEPLYQALGLSVGLVVAGMSPGERRAAYARDITYVTNKEVVFDYLKDRIALGSTPSQLRLRLDRLAGVGSGDRLIHRGLHLAIVDEADSVLIDEARTPLIISGAGQDAVQEKLYESAVSLARALEPGRDFDLDEEQRRVRLKEAGSEQLAAGADELGGLFRGERRREELARLALTALHCYRRDHHYLVKDEKVQIIDEYTGRVMADRSWEHGLHQMIEAKEGVPVTVRPETLARISYQRFFRRYLRLSGMTGTAREVAGELSAVYRLNVVRIPTHRRLRRRSLGERIVPTAEEKWREITQRIEKLHRSGSPVLVGTRSVAASEQLSERLDELQVPYRILNARQDGEEAEIISRAGEPGCVTVATNMAGRGTDIQLAEEVAEREGLFVLASERHEAARIDRQLAGRCGRQGDPGAHEAIVSLEDELFELYAGRVARFTAGCGITYRHSRVGRLALRLAFELAQRTAERRHSSARKDLLRYDAQLDQMLAFSGRSE